MFQWKVKTKISKYLESTGAWDNVKALARETGKMEILFMGMGNLWEEHLG